MSHRNNRENRPPRSNEIDVAIGRNIRKTRERRHVTASFAAISMGMTVGELYALETGAVRASARDLMSFAALFDVPIADFFRDVV